MAEVTSEAHELVDHGLISENDFRDFTFVHPVNLWTRTNPDFFAGTIVAQEVERLRSG